jgi:hypothetical protein
MVPTAVRGKAIVRIINVWWWMFNAMKNNNIDAKYCLWARADCELSEGGSVEWWRSMRKHGNDLCWKHEGLAHFFDLRWKMIWGVFWNSSLRIWKRHRICGEWLSGFGECRQTTKARRKETKRLWTRIAKNVRNLKPERFSRRAKHKRRQTPNEKTSRKWKAKKPVFWKNALLTYLGFGGMKKPWLTTYEDVTKKTNGKT